MEGFVIAPVTSLYDRVPTTLLETATATKRPRGRPKTADRPLPNTMCRVQFAPSPQGPTHIRTIKGGEATSEAFLLTETATTLTSPPIQQGQPSPIPTPRNRAAPFPHKRRLSSPPSPPPAQRLPPLSSPARPARRTHTDLLQITIEEGGPDRDSTPWE